MNHTLTRLSRISYSNLLKYFWQRLFPNLHPKYSSTFGNCYLDFDHPGISKAIAFYGTREEDKQLLLSTELPDTDIYIDIGSNIGVYPLFADKLLSKHAPIYAFEPDPRLQQTLTKNLSLISSRAVTLSNHAVSDENGIGFFSIAKETNLNFLQKTSDSSTFQLSTTSFASILAEVMDNVIAPNDTTNILVRMDIEGGELEIFSSFLDYLRLDKSEAHHTAYTFVFETHPMNSSRSSRFQAVLRELIDNYSAFFHIIVSSSDVSLDILKKIGSPQSTFSSITTDHTVRNLVSCPKPQASVSAITSNPKTTRYAVLKIPAKSST